MLNKGTAFTPDERLKLGLDGLLPSQVNTMAKQADRFVAYFFQQRSPMEKYIALANLQDRNEQLFYRVLTDNIEAMMPIIYTPTVGQATKEFSHVFRRGRGVWITPDHQGRIADVLRAVTKGKDKRLLVVTDNESILGIGDQGAGGMAISIGKLALYCAGARIHPGLTLPISLDVGTNNVSLLDDPLYLGWPHRRLQGDRYYEFVDEFAQAVIDVLPNALCQWEDFRKDKALTIMTRYRDRLLSFNDDIQGTGAVALAGVLAGLRATGGSLKEQRFVIHGAGAAGMGISNQIHAAIGDAGGQTDSVAVLDSRGLLVKGSAVAGTYKEELAWSQEKAAAHGLEDLDKRDLLNVIKAFHPTVLIGASGRPGAFNREIIEAMTRNTERPIVMPFSNPTDYSEARPEEVIRWSNGKALVATGSPFADVQFDGRTFRIGQGNNVFIFPGLGLGALLSGSDKVTDRMIVAAADSVSQAVTQAELDAGMLYPSVARLGEICREVAKSVMAAAGDEGVGDKLSKEQIDDRIITAHWRPHYRRYQAA
jgi:malic enzyme